MWPRCEIRGVNQAAICRKEQRPMATVTLRAISIATKR
jgi:hypothetical protein